MLIIDFEPPISTPFLVPDAKIADGGLKNSIDKINSRTNLIINKRLLF